MTGEPALTTRPIRFTDAGPDPDDLATCARLVADGEVDLIGTLQTPAAELFEVLRQPVTDRAASVFLLDDEGAEPVGFVYVNRDADALQTFFTVNSAPGPLAAAVHARGVAHGLATAKRHAREDGREGWTARSGSWIEDAVHFTALEEHGFAPVRRFYQMLIDSDSPVIPALTPELPPGVEIVVVRDDATLHQVYEVDCAAFEGHWNFVVHSYDDWRAELIDSPDRDPDGVWLVTVDGTPAGLCLLENSRLGLGEGYVGILGVLEQFRGRGLASLMLQRAFVRDRERGLAGTRLGVDAENSTGAVGLYEKVGMRVVRVRQGWMRTV